MGGIIYISEDQAIEQIDFSFRSDQGDSSLSSERLLRVGGGGVPVQAGRVRNPIIPVM